MQNLTPNVTTVGLYVYDIEAYPNFFLAVFKEITQARDGKLFSFIFGQVEELRSFVHSRVQTLVGYNNFNFDDPILRAVLDGTSDSEFDIYELSQALIGSSESNDEERRWLNKHRYAKCDWTCVDLQQIQGGKLAGSLKSHEVRLGMHNVQDLPVEPGTLLSDEQKATIIEYCCNDVCATELLYWDLIELIEVRIEVNRRFHHLDGAALHCSNPAIAESVIRHELKKHGIEKRRLRRPAAYPFNPKQRIDSSIAFTGENNKAMLARIRDLPVFEANDWNRICTQFRFNLNEHTITLGKGGLHTATPAQYVRSEAIVEYDASSYYPSLLRKYDAYPAGLIDSWNKIVNKMTDDRLKEKAAGNKTAADVYKIIINSIYGKLESKDSINYDPALQLQVVINGQLLLMMLMERFQSGGFKVLAANTDGILIDAGAHVQEADAIAEKWMTETQFLLEKKVSTMYVATSVNDYALFEPTKGWFHKKGAFGSGKRTSPTVIEDAVLDHLMTDRDVGSYIRGRNNILEFLYSSSVRSGKVIEVRHGPTILQKTNRWYKSTRGLAIEKIVEDEDGAERIARVPDSDNCAIANRLSDLSLPDDLDFGYYIEKANALLARIEASAPVKPPKLPKLIGQAKKAQRLGLVITPKGRPGSQKAVVPDAFKHETVQYWRDTPLELANWGNHNGFGAYVGQEFGVIGIDIDNLELARKTALFDHLESGGIVAWHGDAADDEIRDGQYRGTVLFRYSGDLLQTTGAQFLAAYGFEILYGKKVAQLAGLHPNGEVYAYKGKLTDIHDGLLNCLSWLMPPTPDPLPNDAFVASDEDIDPLLTQFMAVANSDREYLNIGGSLRLDLSGKHGARLIGLCIGHAAHTNKANEQTMTVAMFRGRPQVGCHHKSCKATTKRWGARVSKGLSLIKPIAVKRENIVIRDDQKEIATALRAPDRYKLIKAPTGSGKTYNIVTFIASQLDTESGSNNKFAIICSSKNQMVQIAERFASVLETDNIQECRIDLIEASANLSVGRARSRESVRPETRVAISHFTYVSRKGFSKEYYSFLKFIDADTHVFIDEVDAFVDSQINSLDLGGRYRLMGAQGIHKRLRMMKCGIFHGYNNCTNCVMSKYRAHRMWIDDFRNLKYAEVHAIMDGDRVVELPHIDVESKVIECVQVGTTEIQMLRQDEEPTEISFETSTERPEFASIVEDFIGSAYLPTVHRPIITYDGLEIDRETAIAQLNLTVDSSLKNVSDDERKRYSFPSRACNILTLTLLDRRPFIWMSNSKSVTGLTATITPFQLRFLNDMFAGLEAYNIPPGDDLMMDKIIVVGMSRTIPLSIYVENQWTFEKMFRFRETQAKAENDFEILKNTDVLIRMGYDKRKYMTSGENERGEHKILQTYSFGSLGRGIDFAEYDLVDVNASIYKPICAYVTDDPETVKGQILEDRANTLAQNIGRILRRSKNKDVAIKVIVIEALNAPDELDAVVRTIAPMSRQSVESWWVPEFIDTEELGEWLTKIGVEKILPAGLPKDYRDMITRARNLIEQGADRKSLKRDLRWETVRKLLSPTELDEVQAAIDALLDGRDSSVRKSLLMTDDKLVKIRTRREKKIHELLAKGQTRAQIHSNMKIKDWAESEQLWFDYVISQAQGAEVMAAAAVESSSQLPLAH